MSVPDMNATIVPLEEGKGKCLICNKVFSQMVTARRHCRDMHMHPMSNKVLKCFVCDKSFVIPRYLTDHLTRKHGLMPASVKSYFASLI